MLFGKLLSMTQKKYKTGDYMSVTKYLLIGPCLNLIINKIHQVHFILNYGVPNFCLKLFFFLIIKMLFVLKTL